MDRVLRLRHCRRHVDRDTVDLGSAVVVYGITAGVVAVGAPLAASALDKRDQFPLFVALGTSVASGFVGWAAASLASIALDDGGDCGSASKLHAENVVLLDLLPLSLAAAPTVIAWTMSDASAHPEATQTHMGIGALADVRRGVVVFARLEL